MSSLIFFGSDQYSAIVLNQLMVNGRWSMINVVTDKHADPSPVEKLAIKHGLKVSYYPSNPDEMIKFNSLMVEWSNGAIPLGLCASFDHLIPADIIDLFAGNLYNLHPSLLPQYRNVSPVQYAIALGDKETGITLFRITSGIDNGAIITQVSEPILEDDTTPTLTSRLFARGAELFLGFLQGSELCNIITSDYKVPNLVFTKRLTRQSGYIEWSVLHKLLNNQPVSAGESTNALLNLRLQKIESKGLIIDSWLLVINDLLRSLSPWPSIWSLVPTKKGELRVSLESVLPEITLKISGKPKAISYTDLQKYYI